MTNCQTYIRGVTKEQQPLRGTREEKKKTCRKKNAMSSTSQSNRKKKGFIDGIERSREIEREKKEGLLSYGERS